jgi:phosphate-selective porin OprO/OprP
MTLKSRPESNIAPQIINTGSFKADNAKHVGAEFYYSNGKFLIGSEVAMHHFQSDGFEDHKFYGGDVAITYLFTKTKRPYNTGASVFGFVPVTKSVFKGGAGEWEAVVRFSTFNLNDKEIQGGSFWRITPMVNWYMSKILRMEFMYGYGMLDRYNMKGALHVFQTRLQLTLM